MKALSPSGVRMYCVKALSKEDKLSCAKTVGVEWSSGLSP